MELMNATHHRQDALPKEVLSDDLVWRLITDERIMLVAASYYAGRNAAALV